ncbi:MAG: hypothetical protein H7174_12925 [Flavobacterium sp.]|nr:hypothetical protein [Flavobacterium sp.]
MTASKIGYLDGSRFIVPTIGTNAVKIMLLSNVPTQTIISGVASTVPLPNGIKVTFDGTFKTETRADYSGTGSVVLKYLDPTDANIGLKMPGNLIA